MKEPTISIIIVNYNTGQLLRSCLESIYAGANGTHPRIWVVDNHSRDRSVAMLRSCFPTVRVIANQANVGFSKANNMAISRSRSKYILLLNPDTVVLGDAVGRIVRLMEDHPEVGVAGGRVLNADGTLQLACRRSIPTPGVAFSYLTGLSRLFPKSRTMGKYNLTFVNPESRHEVDAVSGAFLMIRRKTVEEIGLLDERFFMYGEDLDWCLRVKRAGWTVVYDPSAAIIHYKGQSAKYNSRRAALEFHRAMYLFHRKHFAARCSPLTNILIYAGILCRGLLSWRKLLASAETPTTPFRIEADRCAIGVCE